MIKKIDARIRYTKKIVKEEFFRLLETKPLSDITVTEICSKAGINRATFYKYYDNAYDLLDKLERELLDDLKDSIGNLPELTIGNVFKCVLMHLKEEYMTYSIILSKNGDTEFMDTILKLCYDENMSIINRIFHELTDSQKTWLFYFLGEGCNGILKKWFSSGMKDDIDEIVIFTESIVDTLNRNLKSIK